MRIHRAARFDFNRDRAAMTLAEVVVALAVVSVMLVAALNTVGAAASDQRRIDENERGAMLAKDLMTEIVSQAYEDPTVPGGFGLETGEAGANRLNYDDVDDYNGHSSTPPTTRNGTAIAGCAAFTRAVTITRGTPAAPDTPLGSDGGIKKIVVTVSIGSRPIATLTAYRSKSYRFQFE